MTKQQKIKANGNKRLALKKDIPLILMALPALIILFLFNYVPMFGTVMAFKDFTPREGIWGSPWVGLDNFEYIFSSGDIAVSIRNTMLYNIAFQITIPCCALLISILLFFIKSKKMANMYQSVTLFPYMVSYTVIGYILYIMFKSTGGLLNVMLENAGAQGIAWYTEPKYWPFILVIANAWFGAGVKAVYYYSAFMAIDESLFEAADMDGAKFYHKIFKIMIPSIAPTICIFLISDLGHILQSNFSLYYSLTLDSSALYSVTDVLATYQYRGLTMGSIGTTTALGLFVNVVTVIVTLAVNGIVKKINPDNALF
ncbi:MAG: sugar ABC transporter permease [Tyzzerella sp.]|nr:sugar ABC transporter permease [Tyzzerella sp.]